MDARTLVAVSLFLLIVIVAVAYAAWRVQRRIAERADAERRMNAALEELHRLTTELRARQVAAARAGETLVNEERPGQARPAPGAEGGR